MKKLMCVALALSMTGMVGCASTTTGGAIGVDRKQLMLVGGGDIMRSSFQAYRQKVNEADSKRLLDTNPAQKARLVRIAARLIDEVPVYRSDASKWLWEVHTIKSEELNAYVMPGGKIMFYTGIIDHLNLSDDEIAAIMGHEISHAIREHARERMSRQYASQMGIGIAVASLGLSGGQAQIAGLLGDYGLDKPHSRTQESEADAIGLELMARAGFNPNAAVTLWQKMAAANKTKIPQFLSTHPSSENRVMTLQSMIPKVMPLYHDNK